MSVAAGLASGQWVRVSAICKWDDYSASPDAAGFVILGGTDGTQIPVGLPPSATVTPVTGTPERPHADAVALLERFYASLPADHIDRLGVGRAIEVLTYGERP